MPVGLEEPGSMQSWSLGFYALGARVWWTVGDVCMLIHPGLAPGKVVQWMNNNWLRWESYCSKVGSIGLCMRRSIDRQGRDKGRHRCLPEHCFSTTGLLTPLIRQIKDRRAPDPVIVSEALEAWLKKMLSGVETSLLAPLDLDIAIAYRHTAVKTPDHICAKQLVEGHEIWISHVIEQAEANTSASLISLFDQLVEERKCSDSKISLGVLMLELCRHHRLSWLGRALLQSVGRLVESYDVPEDSSSSPTEGDRVWGGLVDYDLNIHLSMGRGDLHKQRPPRLSIPTLPPTGGSGNRIASGANASSRPALDLELDLL